ncbi:MAG: monooxygenase [Candidatus Nanopelagicales bacterium]
MSPSSTAVPVVTMHLWGVPTRRIPGSFVRMATNRRLLRRTHGLRFCKLLGTGSGETFRLRDADLHHWAVLAVWDSEADARVFEVGSVVTSWDHASNERCRFVLEPVSSHGSWSGSKPFDPVNRRPPSGAVAAITRARVKPSLWRTFARAIPPVAAQAGTSPGLRVSTGIGEAPVGLQGTFTVWDSNSSLRNFAYGQVHQAAINQTAEVGWYSEELFARFAVISAQGTFCGSPVEIGPAE